MPFRLGMEFLRTTTIYRSLFGHRKSGFPWRTIIRLSGIVIGITIIIVLVRNVSWRSVEHTLGLLGWGYVFVLVYPLSWILLNTMGWHYALRAQYAAVPFGQLTQIRLVGETFNTLLPFGFVGGEPIKAKLMSRWVPMAEAAASVLIAKAAQTLALVLFVGLGLTLERPAGGLSVFRQPWQLTAFLLLTAGVMLFMLLLTRRSFSRIGRWLHAQSRHPWLQKQESQLVALDDSLGVFYRDGKRRFLASVLWHGSGLLANAMEVAVIFFLIGHPVTLGEAWLIGAMAQVTVLVGFTPASIGLYEGGHFWAAQALGISPALGLSVALIRRIREVFWNGVGLWLFWKISASKPDPTRIA